MPEEKELPPSHLYVGTIHGLEFWRLDEEFRQALVTKGNMPDVPLHEKEKTFKKLRQFYPSNLIVEIRDAMADLKDLYDKTMARFLDAKYSFPIFEVSGPDTFRIKVKLLGQTGGTKQEAKNGTGNIA